jgi:hypothetical protein
MAGVLTSMGAAARRHRWVLEPSAWLGVGLITAAVLSLAVNVWSPSDKHSADAGVHPRGAVRAADVRHKSEDLYDTSYETCAALGFDRLATAFRGARLPRAVARKYAAGHDPAVRASAYQGCLHALRDELAETGPTAGRP